MPESAQSLVEESSVGVAGEVGNLAESSESPNLAENWHEYMSGVAQLSSMMGGGGGGSAATRRKRKQQQWQAGDSWTEWSDKAEDEGQEALASALNSFLTKWCQKTSAKPQNSLAHQLKDLLQPLIQQRASDEQVAQKVKALLAAHQRARRQSSSEARSPGTQTLRSPEHPTRTGRRVESAASAKEPRPGPKHAQPNTPDVEPRKVQVQPDGRAGGPRQATGPRKSITAVVPSEWTEPVRLAVLSGVLKALATGGDMPGNLVVVSSVEQYLELRDQFAAVACYAPLSVIIDDARRRQMPGVSEVRATVKRGPASPKPETLMLACIPDGAGGPKVKPVVRMDVAKYQPAAKVTVRVSAPSHYRQLFLDRWDTAQTVLTELAQWQDGPVSALLGGQWNWVTTKGTHHLVAHLRVPPSVADQLISRSGRNGILVTKAGVADKAPPQAMLWLKKEDHEDAECYFRRALATANTRNQSLKIRAGGGSDLGVPRLDTDGVPNTPIVIEAQTPRPWESEDVQRFLSDQGWQELTVLSRRKRNKFHVLWTVRGLPPTEETCGPWHYVDQGKPELQVYAAKTVFRGAKATEIFAVTAPSKRFKPEQTPAVQTGKGVEAEGDAHDARSVIKETRPAADDAEQSERDRSPRRKAPAAPAQNPQAEAEDEITQALRSGWVRMDQKGDGDCAFRCVAAARHFNATREALSEDISRREGGLIRGQAVGHIRTHEDTYLPYFAKDRDHDPADPDPSQRGIAQTFHEWLQQMATPNCWADGLTLQGIASKLGFALVIWAKTPEKTWKRVCLAQSFGRDRGSGRFAQMAKDQQPIVLLLEDSHYTWLRPEAPDTTVPRQWLRESVVPERLALAGGGDQAEDCALSSPATPSVHSLESGPDSPKPSVATASVYSLQYSQPATHVDCPKDAQNALALGALLQGTGDPPARKRLKTKQPGFLSLCELYGGRAHTCSTSCNTQAAGAPSVLSQGGVELELDLETPNGPEKPTWPCPECGAVLKAVSSSSLSAMKKHHLRSRHPTFDVTTVVFRQKGSVFTPSASLPRLNGIGNVPSASRRCRAFRHRTRKDRSRLTLLKSTQAKPPRLWTPNEGGDRNTVRMG